LRSLKALLASFSPAFRHCNDPAQTAQRLQGCHLRQNEKARACARAFRFVGGDPGSAAHHFVLRRVRDDA
jgi:hypothetical protein